MTATVTYAVDKDSYAKSEHHVLSVTTEYTYKSDMLIHLWMEKNLCIRLNNRLRYAFRIHKDLQNEHFFFKKTYNQGKAKPISRSVFEEKQKRFDIGQTVFVQNILEEYAYTGKDGCSEEIQITVEVKEDEMTAEISFKDETQPENFVAPVWLIPQT